MFIVLRRALPEYNLTIPQGMREFKPVEYSYSFENGNEADRATCRQQQEPSGNREELPNLVFV
jgi:hypothetical protein